MSDLAHVLASLETLSDPENMARHEVVRYLCDEAAELLRNMRTRIAELEAAPLNLKPLARSAIRAEAFEEAAVLILDEVHIETFPGSHADDARGTLCEAAKAIRSLKANPWPAERASSSSGSRGSSAARSSSGSRSPSWRTAGVGRH